MLDPLIRLFPPEHLPIAALLVLLAAGPVSGQVVLNEIHYEPAENTSREEFIELHNAGEEDVDIGSWRLADGVEFTFPAGAMIPRDGYAVVAEDPETLANALGFAGAYGPWNGKLDNQGERVALRDAAGVLVDEVEYGTSFPWPLSAEGEGSSMELIHPSLDNDLGGSWRPSGLTDRPIGPRYFWIEEGAGDWHYRKATSPPSDPPLAWTELGFAEDASWLIGKTSIGFGDDDDATVLDDMQDTYTGVYLRHGFTVEEGAIPDALKIGVWVDDGAVVWLNGIEVARFQVAEGELPPFDGTATRSHEAREWQEIFVSNPGAILREGENVIAIHALNITPQSNDFSIDARVFRPGPEDYEPGSLAPPTPGFKNSVYAENAPPQLRQVEHHVRQPASGAANLITAKVTDPDGVASVELLVQVVAPGEYVPAFLPVPLADLLRNANTPRPENPEFEDPANWTSIPMHDDGAQGDRTAGDGIFSAIVPGAENRSLVRYRVRATDSTGLSVRVPYEDDPSRNFAYFVYDGVPDYEVRTSITGRPTTWPASALTSVAVYTLLTRAQDVRQAIAADSASQIPQGNQARFAENWEGTFVYDGFVYDHIVYRLRGANGRYQIPPSNPSTIAGKRHWRFRFNNGNFLRARDRFGKLHSTRWKWLNTGRMFGNRLDGNWGLGDQVNDIIWNAYGVPAPNGHIFHWRVIDGAEEAPDQYNGDFWGIARAFENYDVRFLETHDLPKGNLYKLVNQTQRGLDQLRYQAPYAVADGSDHDNIERNLRSTQSDAWLRAHVEWDAWYRYHSIAQAIRHYDYWPEANKNAAWYFYPDYRRENGFLGKMWTLPFDADATWGPTWNEGWDRPYDAIFGGGGRRSFQIEYRNHVREVRDLLFQREQLELVIRQTAAFIEPLEGADTDRWRNAPAAAGRQYFSNTPERTVSGKADDMLRFAFAGGSWPGGSVGAGGRAAFLDNLADRTDSRELPEQPGITYVGPEGYPSDRLTFQTSEFTDPQGPDTFGSLEWRLAEVTKIVDAGSRPLSDPIWKLEPAHLEIEALWSSGAIDTMTSLATVPVYEVEPGHTYRVRVRMTDEDGYASHWSLPAEFTAAPPAEPIAAVESLRVTEMMFNPPGGEEYEFIELQNRGAATLDLTHVRFTAGIEFDFAESDVHELGPGEVIVIAGDRESFAYRYDTSTMTVAGEYRGRLANDGERIRLVFGRGHVILDFEYSDDWYPEADGAGRSLEIADPDASAGAWSLAESWSPSSEDLGTPGRVGASLPPGELVRPGDANLDGAVDLSDAVSLLFLLFGGRADPPCGANLQAPGNLALLDHDGTGTINITDAVAALRWLFQSGPPHVLGTACRRFEGCPASCGD